MCAHAMLEEAVRECTGLSSKLARSLCDKNFEDRRREVRVEVFVAPRLLTCAGCRRRVLLAGGDVPHNNNLLQRQAISRLFSFMLETIVKSTYQTNDVLSKFCCCRRASGSSCVQCMTACAALPRRAAVRFGSYSCARRCAAKPTDATQSSGTCRLLHEASHAATARLRVLRGSHRTANH
jgi:hypothetical protein